MQRVRRTSGGRLMAIQRRGLYTSAALLLASQLMPEPAQAQASPAAAAAVPANRITALIPGLEARITTGMKAFDAPGLAVGIVADDRIVYAKGFGVRGRQASAPVSPRTVFQIGSTTKAFCATLLAIAVDRGKLAWDDRVVDVDPAFALGDPYATREFRIYDILAQRSGLPPYANDFLIDLGFTPEAMMHSLRFVMPASSFRAVFTYTNITHLFGGRIAARALGFADWPTATAQTITGPLGMADTSFTFDGIESAPDHALGHGWTPDGAVERPYDPGLYGVGPAGAINSTVEDCAAWLRLLIADGMFAGRRIVSEKNLAVTRVARVGLEERISYAMGWLLSATPNGRVIFHNGGTGLCGAHIGFLPDKKIGMVVLTNLDNRGLADALALEFYDRVLGNPAQDRVQRALAAATKAIETEAKNYALPKSPAAAPADDSILGRYANEITGPATLARDDGRLVMRFAHGTGHLELRPFAGPVVTVRVAMAGSAAVPANAARVGSRYDLPGAFGSFEPGSDGRIGRFRLLVGAQSVDFAKQS